ncbi:Flagellin assembly, membrane protein MviN [Syntrophomonas zehnderi OL-4]|uniref:Probable lipid II flippase MurJ n=1 Tax=Syntrophomonas zehnderi OL-4 TaxID=690567 RepID=A0A0E4C7R7_9FIRM|nr:murein biosynthesis integral membrane protein MurJ [Syntrophomonas zehnderi]CFX11496.1 Flagellin assembly, membrane protein MviN [Syntrophomonas zehnderi OL-4]
MDRESAKTGKTFIGVSVVIFFSKALGFVRDIVMAFVFGTTLLTDLFQAIFSLPSLLFSSIGNALSFVNIPDLTFYLKHKTREERNRYLANLYAQVSLGAALISFLGIVFAPALARLIVPGMADQAFSLAVLLTRIMIPTLLFVTLTYITAGVLQVHGYFLMSAAISIPFNLLIIAALFLKGQDIIFLGYVTTIGWLLQFLIQLPILVKEKYQFPLSIDWKNEHTVNMFKQLLPILLGNSLLQLCLVIDRTFGTHLEEGTTAALGFGSTLFMTITGIFIIALSTVIFPRISAYCLEGDFRQLRSILRYGFKILVFILLPYLLLVVAYSQDIVSLLYERGAFNAASTQLTATAFLGYSFAVVGYACQELFNRVYYALKKFHTPMYASLFCLLLHLLLNLLWFRQLGIVGLAVSTSIALLVYALIMGFMVYRVIGAFLGADFWQFLLHLLLPVGGMVLCIVLGRHLLPAGIWTSFLLPLLVSGTVYLLLAWWIGLADEIKLKEEPV